MKKKIDTLFEKFNCLKNERQLYEVWLEFLIVPDQEVVISGYFDHFLVYQKRAEFVPQSVSARQYILKFQ